MRNVVDQNEAVQIVKISDMKGNVVAYQAEDKTKKPGTEGYVINRFVTLMSARKTLGMERQATNSKITLPKSAYPEQQTGFTRGKR